jgi:hypothetical protein
LTVNPTTVARPDTTVGAHERLRHTGHTGTGGWTSALQSWHPWTRRRPSAPEVQNHSVTGVSWGSGRTGWGQKVVFARKPTAGDAAGNEPLIPALK